MVNNKAHLRVSHGTIFMGHSGAFDSKLLHPEVRRNHSAVSNEIDLRRARDDGDQLFATT